MMSQKSSLLTGAESNAAMAHVACRPLCNVISRPHDKRRHVHQAAAACACLDPTSSGDGQLLATNRAENRAARCILYLPCPPDMERLDFSARFSAKNRPRPLKGGRTLLDEQLLAGNRAENRAAQFRASRSQNILLRKPMSSSKLSCSI